MENSELSDEIEEAEARIEPESEAGAVEGESLIEMKCARLERQVKGYKQVVALRKDLLEIRERESKELIAKLKSFEVLISAERDARTQLRRRIESAEQQCNELRELVQQNALARREYETNNLNLSTELSEARQTLLVQSEQNEVLEASVQELKLKCTELEQILIQNSIVRTEDADLQAVVEEANGASESAEAVALEISVTPEAESAEAVEPEVLEPNAVTSEALASPEAGKSELLESPESVTPKISVSTKVLTPEILNSAEGRMAAESAEAVRELRDELNMVLEKNRIMSYQMSLLNTLFTETEGTPIDFDRIKAIGDIVRESQSNSSFGNTVNPEDEPKTDPEADRERRQLNVSLIMDKLDAIEGHPVIPVPGVESCYTSVDTGAGGGPKLVLSVSRTFIKLKDLILEKKSLQQEIDGLKELNTKLESKVDTQERRLYRVALELNKTWSLVSKLKAQHSQLHSSKAVLRYELNEKRKLLEKLKYDLKTSHDKWIKVRQKNSESQIEWQSIRDEFTRRRQEACPSRESAFSSEALSSVSNENELEHEETAEKVELNVTLNEPLDLEEKASNLADAEVDAEVDTEEPELVLVHDEFVEDLVEEIDDIEAAVEDEDEEVVVIDGSAASWEELVNRRALRLRILEEQCRLLYTKLQASTARNAGLSSKLVDLHNHYGSENSPDTAASSVKEPDENEIGCESSTDTAYASADIGQTDDDLTEVTSDNDEDVVVMSDAVELLQTPKPRSRRGPLSQSESDINVGITADERRRVSVPTTATTQDLIAELRTLIMDDEEENTNDMNSTDSDYAVPPPDTAGCVEEDLEPDESESRSSPSGDLNALGRILIQQLPKRLEVLKEENAMLRERMMSSNAQSVAGCSSGVDMELRNELELKQKVIEELTNKIQVATENYETINREHGRMAEYFKIKMQERLVQEQRKLAKATNVKNCSQCEKRFTLFKRKHNCSVCGHRFCADCLLEEQPRNESASNTRKQKKVRICSSCTLRRRQLEAVVIESVD